MVFVKKLFLWAMLLALCLTACSQSPQSAATPSPALSPSPTAAAPSPTPTSSPALSPSEELKELWGFPIDDTHDAFEVPTGGKLGTVLVTVEQEQSDSLDLGDFLFAFSVWSADDLTTPIQTMKAESYGVFHWGTVQDANFDGYMDFGYMYAMGNQPSYWHYWIWDEDKGQFVQEPEFDKISEPQFDAETEIISGWARSSAASDGVQTYHKWENGKLVCVRRITTDYWPNRGTVLVEDRVNGELKQVFYQEFLWDENEPLTEEKTADWFEAASKWYDLSYHG